MITRELTPAGDYERSDVIVHKSLHHLIIKPNQLLTHNVHL